MRRQIRSKSTITIKTALHACAGPPSSFLQFQGPRRGYGPLTRRRYRPYLSPESGSEHAILFVHFGRSRNGLSNLLAQRRADSCGSAPCRGGLARENRFPGYARRRIAPGHERPPAGNRAGGRTHRADTSKNGRGPRAPTAPAVIPRHRRSIRHSSESW